MGDDRDCCNPFSVLNSQRSTRKTISNLSQIFRALEKNPQRVNERIQQYSTTVEIQLKAVRCKKFSTIAFVTDKKHPSDRLEKKNETSTNEKEK